MLDDFKPRRSARVPAKKHTHLDDLRDESKDDTKRDDVVSDVETSPPKHIDETIDVPEKSAKAENKPDKPKKKWWHIISYRHTHLKRWQWAILVVCLLLLIVGGAYGAIKLYRHFKVSPQAPGVVAKKKEQPKTEASCLSGLQIDPGLNKRPVTGVMIENSPDARPQSGLRDAGIVFEAIAEGGITRFLALFQDTEPQYIGPVRSARPYYLDWVLAFDASLAHVGGSPDALKQIKDLHVRDLDQFANAGTYTRVSSRFAPHNVYTSFSKLDDLNKKKGYTSSHYTCWNRKTQKAVSPPTARLIDLKVSGFLYSPHYQYDASNNDYKRSEGGKPHIDEKSGVQLSPKVVVVLVTPYSVQSDGIHSNYTTVGSGHMYVFQDGGVTEGTWQKSSRSAQLTFKDSSGTDIKLNPGQTWVTLVKDTGSVSYKP